MTKIIEKLKFRSDEEAYLITDAAAQTEISAIKTNKQDTLVSGTNIKTINNESILGEGNIVIQGGADNVYTKDNLVAGNGIEFEEKQAESGGIDEHTLGVWHLDNGNLDNSVAESNFSVPYFEGRIEEGRFNTAIKLNNTGAASIQCDGQYSDKELTFDFWVKPITSGTLFSQDTYIGRVSINSDNTINWTTDYGAGGSNNSTKKINIGEWNHIAYVRNEEGVRVFCNGELYIFKAIEMSEHSFYQLNLGAYFTNLTFDEIRLSSVARWTEDFDVPTTPYTEGEDRPAYTAINSTIAGFDFVGTLEEYETETLADDAKCFITDDVGNIPTEITQEQLNDKADRDLGNCTRPYVVTTYNSSDVLYRIYSDKYCELHFLVTGLSNGSNLQTINLPIEFANTDYFVQVSAAAEASSWQGEAMNRIIAAQRTTTTFVYQGGQASANPSCWFSVFGYIL